MFSARAGQILIAFKQRILGRPVGWHIEDNSTICKKFYILGKERNLEEREKREEGISDWEKKQIESNDL